MVWSNFEGGFFVMSVLVIFGILAKTKKMMKLVLFFEFFFLKIIYFFLSLQMGFDSSSILTMLLFKVCEASLILSVVVVLVRTQSFVKNF